MDRFNWKTRPSCQPVLLLIVGTNSSPFVVVEDLQPAVSDTPVVHQTDVFGPFRTAASQPGILGQSYTLARTALFERKAVTCIFLNMWLVLCYDYINMFMLEL